MAERPPDRPPRKNNNKPVPPNGGLKFGRGVIGWLIVIGVVMLFVVLFSRDNTKYQDVSLDKFWAELGSKNVASVIIESDLLKGQFKNPILGNNTNGQKITTFRVETPAGVAQSPEFTLRLLDSMKDQGTIKAENSQNVFVNLILPVVPWLLIILFVWYFVFRQLRNSAGAGGMLGNFGKSKHRITAKEHTHVTFDDVAGIEEAKDEVMEIVEFLRNPKKFQRLGGRIPRGVLLVGEPGTGKTLLAKAIAGEADVPFFSISGSDFVEMFVGVGASRVRDLFKQAKDNSPCIIFLDEIDAVGRRRGSGFTSGGHDEREQTLNAILVEMDGFDTNDQVIVIASTNRVDVLDPALTRPGRFDRQVYVPLPDVKGRLEILKVHARKVKLGPKVDLMRLARATPGFSGADLAAIINEAALHATLAGKDFIEMDDLEESRDKVRWGRAHKSRVIDEKEKEMTAYHEAGHAVLQYVLRPDSDPLHKVTIIPRGQAGGVTMSLPEKDRLTYSRRWCLAVIKVLFGGRLAEELFFNDVNSGVAMDIRQATRLARHMIRDWGMNDRVGFVFYGEDDSRPNVLGGFGEGREYSEETARLIDEEVKKLIDSQMEEARALMMRYRDRVDAVAKALMHYETLDAGDVERIMNGEVLTKPTVTELLDKENKRGTVIQPGSDNKTPDVHTGLGGPGTLPAPG